MIALTFFTLNFTSDLIQTRNWTFGNPYHSFSGLLIFFVSFFFCFGYLSDPIKRRIIRQYIVIKSQLISPRWPNLVLLSSKKLERKSFLRTKTTKLDLSCLPFDEDWLSNVFNLRAWQWRISELKLGSGERWVHLICLFNCHSVLRMDARIILLRHQELHQRPCGLE